MQQKKKDGEKKLVADSSTPALATAVTPSTDDEVAEVAEVKAAKKEMDEKAAVLEKLKMQVLLVAFSTVAA